jgi:hypothetical protein
MTQYMVSDAGDPRKYYTQIPNMIDDSDLSVYAFRLYARLKRVAGDGGKCYQSTKTLSTACKMSMGSVKKAKEELAAAGLIVIKVIPGEHGEFASHEITITDIWQENMSKYAACSPDEQEPFTTRTGAGYHVNRTVSPGETKNNPIKNNNKNNGDQSPLSPGVHHFLAAFGAKRFKTTIQKDTVAALEETYGAPALKDAAEWAAKKGMSLGDAVVAVESALKKRNGAKPGSTTPAPLVVTPGQER